jgi:hypothetical protein
MPGEAARGWLSLAARSARGGTTGRAAGCPASGRDGGLGAAGMGAPGAAGPPATEELGVRAATPGRLKIGVDAEEDGEIGSLPGGIAWRGPESTWPGRGGGTGLATGGMGRPGPIGAAGGICAGGGGTRGAAGTGCVPGGELPASGGRMGSDGRPACRSGGVVPAAGSGVFSSNAAAGGWRRGPPGAVSGAGEVSAAAGEGTAGAVVRASGSAYSSGTSWPKTRRNLTATSSSIELEWVFFSVTPNSGSLSRISCALTSSSRASSLIRILFINTKLSC